MQGNTVFFLTKGLANPSPAFTVDHVLYWQLLNTDGFKSPNSHDPSRTVAEYGQYNLCGGHCGSSRLSSIKYTHSFPSHSLPMESLLIRIEQESHQLAGPSELTHRLTSNVTQLKSPSRTVLEPHTVGRLTSVKLFEAV